MTLNLISLFIFKILFVNQKAILTILIVVIVFFGILLLLGIRKSYRLKKENERLDKISEELAKKKEEEYKDFTGGHMYQ